MSDDYCLIHGAEKIRHTFGNAANANARVADFGVLAATAKAYMAGLLR